LGAISQDYGERRFEEQRPLIGIFSCLLCERRFSTKIQLKRHYYKAHRENIANYEGKTLAAFGNEMNIQGS
jgi:hypothetical protein